MIHTVETLFPGSAVKCGLPGKGADFTFGFVPSAKRPNLVVPTTAPSAAARTIWRFGAATGLKDSGIRGLSGMALKLGAARLFKDTVTVFGADRGIVGHLESVLGEPVTISIAIGSARANRKPVLEVFSVDGRRLAFAKVGVDDVSRRDVTAEAENLRSLVGHMPEGLVVPSVISEAEWRGHAVLTMTTLRTRWQRPGARSNIPVELMREFSRAWGTASSLLEETAFWDRLHERISSLTDPTARQRLLAAADRLSQWAQAVRVDTGAWHGDWTPWNMAWCDGKLQLWDLERLDRDGLVGLDVVHYVVNEHLQRYGASPEQLARAAAAAEVRLPFDADKSRLIVAAYLLAISVRYHVSAAGTRGELIADRAELMTDGLEEFLRQ